MRTRVWLRELRIVQGHEELVEDIKVMSSATMWQPLERHGCMVVHGKHKWKKN